MKQKHLFRHLDTNGDGTGTKNAVGDYSSTPTDFKIQPAANQMFILHRMLVFIKDTTGIDADAYGNGIVLTNGINIKYSHAAGVVVDMVDGIPITVNGDWGRLCYDVELKAWGAGNEILVVRWTFDKAGEPLVLNGADGDRFVVSLNDDFSGLLAHYFMVQGQDLGQSIGSRGRYHDKFE